VGPEVIGDRFGRPQQVWAGLPGQDDAPYRRIQVYAEAPVRLTWSAGALPGAGSPGKFGAAGYADLGAGEVGLTLPTRGALYAAAEQNPDGGKFTNIYTSTGPSWSQGEGSQGVVYELLTLNPGTNDFIDIPPQGCIYGQALSAASFPLIGFTGILLLRSGVAAGTLVATENEQDIPPLDSGWTLQAIVNPADPPVTFTCCFNVMLP